MTDQGDRLRAFWEAAGGRLYLDVVAASTTVGGWPDGTEPVVLDAVHFPDHPDAGIVNYEEVTDDFAVDITRHRATVVVARGYYDRPLLGLLEAGIDLLSRAHPDHRLLTGTAVADPTSTEANMGWVFHRHGFTIHTLPGDPP